MSEKTKKEYKNSLNLPQAKDFPMKAGLLQKEPEIQKEWDKTGLFSAIKEKSKEREKFVLHDGPPYANGSIHIGHLLNKILKDIVVRSKTMEGFDSFLTPGWDCHGLPIEHKVLKESEDLTAEADPIQIRKKCRNYADKFVRKQTKEMKRLGTVADYENPYLTMTPEYEAGVLEVFSKLVAKNIVRHDLKPVHWSIENKTALAEAELEYHEKTDPSVYVLFPVANTSALPQSLNAPAKSNVFLMIWTTTPWTLPANRAIAAARDAKYGLYAINKTEKGDRRFCVVSENLAESIFEQTGADARKLGSCSGEDLADAQTAYNHPFVEYQGRVICAPHVGTDEGTGLVHTAPGHGAEDYSAALKEGIEIYCPVREDGTFDESVPGWLHGKNVWKGNGIVIEKLREAELLFHSKEIVHSYPHDWRGKTPTIFRATAQWFIRMDEPVGNGGKTLRELALASIADEIRFHPEWGSKRLGGMVESRPDWCISRQRAWGLPIPAFTNAAGDILMTEKTVLAVAEKIREKGSNAWFESDSEDLIGNYDPSEDADAPAWAKENWNPSELKKGADIFDVWFESGSSWHSVIEKGEQRKGGKKAGADMYLEGSDQHRGWFQSSFLNSLGVNGKPPFEHILTHGFIVDAQGRKMSKSAGNALDVEQVLKQYGADVCRWWVSSLNYSNDVKADIRIIEGAADEYRTIRNTIRFLLSNLDDFNPETDSIALNQNDEYLVDNVARIILKKTVNETVSFYSAFEYKAASGAILAFCDLFLSKHYIGAVRDRLYCDKADSERRRKTQTVIFEIADALIRLCAPILVHTAEEAYHCLSGDVKEASVHLTDFPRRTELSEKENSVLDEWETSIIPLKDQCLLMLEKAKKEDNPSNPLDAGMESGTDIGNFDCGEIADLLGASRFENGGTLSVKNLTDESKCDRCWKREKTASQRADGGTLCDRCADAVEVK
ncbi:MAG: isoleucine--tRNA ligase [Candidatus Mycalebacterium zealandia]|nr:MAG: isoleucine--tRNA ligase [Candidatus Mycalebacterium zealandia]